MSPLARLARLLRKPNASITRLYRNPPQLQAIARGLAGRDRLRLLVHAMADGAEPVSLLIALDPARRPVDLQIEGRDLSAALVADARRFSWSRLHAPRDVDLGSFGAYLRRRPFGGWSLREPWRGIFHYAEGDVLRPAPDLPPEAFDLVACQNLLISLPEESLTAAFANLVSQLAPGGLLAVGGGPLGRVHRLAREHGLEPVLDDVEAIHEAWEVQRAFWDKPRRPYWALEPFAAGQPEGPERYCTLFRKAGRP